MAHPGRLLLIVAVALQLSCSGMGEGASPLGKGVITPDQLLNASPLAEGVVLEDLSQVDILGMTPEMVEFVDYHIDGAENPYARMNRLVNAIMGEGEFRLQYDDITRTASETFQDRHGNCLSFTNMFVAMARYLGLHASFQEVDIPPDWSLIGESFLFIQHVNVYVDLGVGTIRIVDFDSYDFTTSHKRRIISDETARAHYFSNLGVDHMLNGDAVSAYVNFRQAILEDGNFTSAWVNLGILHRRKGFPQYAEAAFLQALAVAPSNLVATSNLASLYEEQGLIEEAAYYEQQVLSHRMNNPYYRYYRAQNAIIEGDYRGAIEHLEFAIDEREKEDRFYFLMSVAYLMSGDREAADEWMARAEEIAGEENDLQHYHDKLDWLRSQDGDG